MYIIVYLLRLIFRSFSILSYYKFIRFTLFLSHFVYFPAIPKLVLLYIDLEFPLKHELPKLNQIAKLSSSLNDSQQIENYQIIVQVICRHICS